jgi:hypothetical protein
MKLSPTMSAAIGGDHREFHPHQSLRSWWGLVDMLAIE